MQCRSNMATYFSLVHSLVCDSVFYAELILAGNSYVRPCQANFLSSITFSICVWAGGHYSLFVTSKRLMHQANLRLYNHCKWACQCLKGDNDSWGGMSKSKRALMRNNYRSNYSWLSKKKNNPPSSKLTKAKPNFKSTIYSCRLYLYLAHKSTTPRLESSFTHLN